MLALLVRVDSLDDGSSRTYTFTRSPVRIGRNPLNDLSIPRPFVSQWHAVVQFDDSNAAFYDLGSTNGTTCNGRRLEKNAPVGLTGSEDLRVGAVRITFSRGHVSEAMAAQQRLSMVPSGGDPGVGEHTMMAEGLGGHDSLGESGSSTMMIDGSAILAGLMGGQGAPAPQAPRPAAGVTQLGPVRGQILALGGRVTAYRQSWNDLYASLYGVLQQTPPQLVPAALQLFLEQFPDAASEPQMQALAQSQGVALPAGASGGAGSQLIARLAQALLPSQPPPQTPEEMEGFLVRILTSLDAFSTAFVGLRQGHEQFEAEMVGGSRKSAQPSPVEEATDPRAVLAYLLDWHAQDAQVRAHNLTSQYAEIMTHQVALLSGLMEGVRKLLADRLSPDRIARVSEEKAEGFWKVWPFKSGLHWRQYLKEHDDLSEDKELTTAVFGRVFAKAYARALGENFADAGPRRIGAG
jgi:type VI secretion system protein